MADFDSAHPDVDDPILDVVPLLRGQMQDLAKGADPAAAVTITNPSNGMKRLNTSNSKIERWDGASWVEWVQELDMNVARLGGHPASYFTNVPALLTYVPAPVNNAVFTGSVTLPAATVFAAQTESEGGQFMFQKAAGDLVTQGSGVMVDLEASGRIRLFESGGTLRGAYIDVSEMLAGVGSKLFHSGDMGHGSGLDADTVDGVHASSLSTRFGEVSLISMDATTSASIFTQFSPAQGTPDGANHFSIVHASTFAAAGFQFSASLLNADDYYLRKRLAGVWQPWRKVLHDGNLNPATKLNVAGGTLTGSLVTSPSVGATIGAMSGAGIEVRGGVVVGHPAAILFHKPASFAAYFGLGEDNQWRVGGFSYGNTSLALLRPLWLRYLP
jgi:hypothetical protein